MRFIRYDEECIGKYRKQCKAEDIALKETERTGIEQHAFLSHYYCPYDGVDKMFWGVIVSKTKK